MSEKLEGEYYDVEVKTEDSPYFFVLANSEGENVAVEVRQRGSYAELVGLFATHAMAMFAVAKKEGKNTLEAYMELIEVLSLAKEYGADKLYKEVMQ
jgi:hypothetical protein